MDYIIKTEDLHKSFPLGNHEILDVLKGVNIEIPTAKLTILKGRSGSGKTTLLNILSMLDDPTSGKVFIDGNDIGRMSLRQKESMRRFNVGFVFQSVALVPIMSAYENVDFALKLADYKGDRDKRIKDVLSVVGLDKRMTHMPSQMSGGEQQRVAIARALDTLTGLGIIKLFKELIEKEGITIVMTTHDPNLMAFGDAVYEMEDGELKYVPAEL